MLTIFSTPKDFIGHFDIIQTNAVNSWRALSNDIEIIIFGDSKGAKEIADSINALYIENVPSSDNGLPTIPGLFESAEQNGSNNIYCFLNSDIILSPDFLPAIKNIYSQKKKFLAVGYRFNLDVESIIDFSSQFESNIFFKNAQQEAIKGISSAIDLFCFTKGVYKNIPKFTVGRPGFDNWLLWKARRTFIPVIDITLDSKVFHQNHSFNYKGIKSHADVLNSKEAKLNYKLMGEKGLSLNDTNWILNDGILKKKRDNSFKQRNLGKISIIYPEFAFFLIWYKRLYRRISNMIHRSMYFKFLRSKKIGPIIKYFRFKLYNPAKFWNEFGGRKYFEKFHNLEPRNEDVFLQYIEKYQPKTILDIGCGYGRYLKSINTAYPNISLWGADIAESQVRMAQKYLADCENIELSVTDGIILPYSDKMFDMSITYGCFSAVKKRNLDQFFSEIIRTTKSVGVFIENSPEKDCDDFDNIFNTHQKLSRYYWYKHDYATLFAGFKYTQTQLNDIGDTLFVVKF